MKKILSLLVTFLYVTIASSQSIQKLDNNPSFKGITIGAPISKYSEILLFSHVYLGRNIYHVRASNYLSIFTRLFYSSSSSNRFHLYNSRSSQMQIHHNPLLHSIRVQVHHPLPVKPRISIMNNTVMIRAHDHLVV